jgi:uncharacterized protein (TIGR02186 family)
MPQCETPTISLEPKRIEVGAFYSGANVKIRGRIQQDSGVVVVLRGADREEVFNKKTRFGPIWIASGKVRIAGVPSLFLRFSSHPLDSLLHAEVIDQRLLDHETIRKKMQIDPEQSGDHGEIIRSNYLALKMQEGIYQTEAGLVSLSDPAEGLKEYFVDLDWPRKAPPATYEVKVLECRDGEVVGEVSTPLPVVKVGFPAELAFLANQHSSLYGALAVVIAVIAGFGIDFLASKILRKKRTIAH